MPTLPPNKKRPWQSAKPANPSGSRSQAPMLDGKPFYHTKEWRSLRNAFRTQFPLCKHCLENNKVTQMHTVDHILPIRQGGGALDWNNLQSLCEKCNARKTSFDGKGAR